MDMEYLTEMLRTNVNRRLNFGNNETLLQNRSWKNWDKLLHDKIK